MNNQIIQAIENRNVVQFYFENELRVVEPHCYDLTTAGNEGLRAFQIDGYSSSGKMGWKMYDLGKAVSIKILKYTYSSARIGNKKGDKGMDEIYAELLSCNDT